ncbi:cobalt permease [Caloranaerobacter sp. TR13]|uniref:energy-coupling factor transporter transmembrane component T family protein n=1 Tax=Caloranaerobacter sp. TR13 TaxID=1302151 RepID=UPI0006D3BB3B|nr:energy-coupling factor transporter transmembrane component T [Caloranaerobacter sp. TR13]KPU27269.1 cobalt permease [Caloranaerobacter sp. TR13]
MIEEWLLVKDEYVPEKESNKFIDKSIISILKVLSRIRRSGIKRHKFVYSLNPTLKVFFTILSLVLLSLSRSFIYVLVMNVYAFANILILDAEERSNILVTSLVIPLFTLIMLIPSMLRGNIANNLLLLQKIIVNIILVNCLSYTTKWNQITKSLKLLFIPDLFIWVMEITIKYIVLLGEYSVNLLYALKIRSVGKNYDKYNSLFRIIGNLFLKSKQMSEEMFSAMECRGFVGEYTIQMKFSFKKADLLYCIVNISLVVIFLVTNYL